MAQIESKMERNANQEKLKVHHRKQCQEYLKQTPALRQLMQDFMTEVLAHKPDDINEFAKIYFSNFITSNDTEKES